MPLSVVGQDAEVPAARELDAAEVPLIGREAIPRPVTLGEHHSGGGRDPETGPETVVVQ